MGAQKALHQTETRELLRGMEENSVSPTRGRWFVLQVNQLFFFTYLAHLIIGCLFQPCSRRRQRYSSINRFFFQPVPYSSTLVSQGARKVSQNGWRKKPYWLPNMTNGLVFLLCSFLVRRQTNLAHIYFISFVVQIKFEMLKNDAITATWKHYHYKLWHQYTVWFLSLIIGWFFSTQVVFKLLRFCLVDTKTSR